MRTFFTLAYPALDEADRQFIERFRSVNDLRYRDVVSAHFTLVFACTAVEEARYVEHVRAVAGAAAALPFVCRYAMLGADDEDDTAYVYLVPDEGYSGLSLLHDRLYEGVLQPHLRLDIPYVPHITLGTLQDRKHAKTLCDELNGSGIRIAGRADTLSACVLEGSKVHTVASFPLLT